MTEKCNNAAIKISLEKGPSSPIVKEKKKLPLMSRSLCRAPKYPGMTLDGNVGKGMRRGYAGKEQMAVDDRAMIFTL